MYRTPDQDQRLQDLYVERERILTYAETHGVDVSLALDGVDSEIELLTGALDEPQTVTEAVASVYGEVLPEDELLALEIVNDSAWLNGWNKQQTKYVKLSYVAPGRYVIEFHRDGKIRYYRNQRFVKLIERMTRPVMFSGGLRVLA